MTFTVLQIIPNLGAGGAEQSCVEIVEGLVAQGHRALVVSAGGSRVEEIERLGAKHITKNVNSKNPLAILKNAAWLARIICDEHVNIVHARSRAPAWSAWLACLDRKKLFVTTFHAAYKFSHPLKKFYNRVMTRGDRIIAISHFIEKHIIDNYAVDPKKIHVIYRCVDLERFKPEAVTEDRRVALRQAWGLKEGQRLILLPARLSPIKGHKLFIETMACLVKDGNVPIAVIVGDDQGREAYRRELEELIESKGLEGVVKLVNHCVDMPAAYTLADVIVVPSLVPEGFGRVPVEAMAMGVPVIASDLGATAETVIEGETGWRLPPENPQAWANALANTLNLSPDDRARMVQKAIRTVRDKFSHQKMVEATLAVYGEIAR